MSLRIFISYRRADSDGQYLAHMIFRALGSRYGKTSVFLDVDSTRPGLSFPDKVREALDKCNVVLVIIGSQWLANLKQRENDERDWVRYEISESLRRPYLPVVPIRHPATEFPTATQLPKELQGLALRDGASLDPFREFEPQFTRLLEALEEVVRDQERSARSPIKSTRDMQFDLSRSAKNISAASPNNAQTEPLMFSRFFHEINPRLLGSLAVLVVASMLMGSLFFRSARTAINSAEDSAAIIATSASRSVPLLQEKTASQAQPVNSTPENNSIAPVTKPTPPLNEDRQTPSSEKKMEAVSGPSSLERIASDAQPLNTLPFPETKPKIVATKPTPSLKENTQTSRSEKDSSGLPKKFLRDFSPYCDNKYDQCSIRCTTDFSSNCLDSCAFARKLCIFESNPLSGVTQ